MNLSNGGPYSGVNTATLTVSSVTLTMDNYVFRAIVDGPPCGSVTSATARLIVHAIPGAVLTAAEYSTIQPNTPSGLYVTVSPVGQYTYQWFRDNNLLPNVTGSSMPLDLDDLGTYSVTVTNAITGCSKTTNLVTIKDSVSNILFIYPNPSNGQFQVRYYNEPGTQSARVINVYDAKGSKVYSGAYTVTGPYDMMGVDISRQPAGTYVVDLLGQNGKRLASGRVVVRR